MSALGIVITVFVIGGILYNFSESAAENGIDLFHLIFRMFYVVFLLLLYPFLAIYERMRNKT